jgi:hypothetical protein
MSGTIVKDGMSVCVSVKVFDLEQRHNVCLSLGDEVGIMGYNLIDFQHAERGIRLSLTPSSSHFASTRILLCRCIKSE